MCQTESGRDTRIKGSIRSGSQVQATANIAVDGNNLHSRYRHYLPAWLLVLLVALVVTLEIVPSVSPERARSQLPNLSMTLLPMAQSPSGSM